MYGKYIKINITLVGSQSIGIYYDSCYILNKIYVRIYKSKKFV